MKNKRRKIDTGEGNLDMIKNSVRAIKHHADELTSELKKNPEIEAWVLAKTDRAAQNLSDVTHYLDGEMNKYAKGGDIYDKYEMVLIAKELEKDGGYKHKFRYLVSAKNLEEAKNIVTEMWYEEMSNSDLSIVEVMPYKGGMMGRYTVNVYYGGEMEDEVFYTDNLFEAKKISQQGEHSEIYDNVKKVFIEEEYADGGEVDEEDSLDYNSISDLQSERNRLVRWKYQYNSKGADYKIKQLEERIEYLKSKEKMADGGMIQDFEIYDEQTGKSLFIKARSLDEAEGISETIDFDDYENGDIVDVLDDIDSYQEYADGGMIWASPNLRKKYEDAFGKIQDMLPEYAIESSKKELLIESYYWNYLLDVLEIEELDEKVANDWKVAREVEDGKLVQKGPYATRYMYSPSLDRLREQNEGEWYQYGSVSDTFAKGGIVTKSKVISELQKLGFGKEKAENLLEKHIDIYEINEDDEDAKTIALQIEEQYNQEYAKGGSILDLKDVYNELRSRIGRLEINEETSNYIYCDIRDWGNWEHDYEDYDRDEEDFEDDDAMILSRESSMRMSNIVNEVRAKYPSASISWNTSEKNYIDFQISRKMAKGGKVKERVYIDYLNKAKGFQKDRKYFDSYEDAVKWARSHFDKFDTDYIKYEY